MKNMKRSILAGMMISVGSVCYLSIENKVLGAFIFSVGLLVICRCGLHLYTGKICYAECSLKCACDMIDTLFGNMIGTLPVSLLMLVTRKDLSQRVVEICEKKLSEGVIEEILLSFMCGVLIFFAVEGYKETGSELVVILCVTAFIVCGFEHCIANGCYLIMANKSSVLYFIVNVLGNSIGGIFAYRMYKKKSFHICV